MTGEVQGRNSPPSSLHSVVGATVEPCSEVVNPKVAAISSVSASGPESIVSDGKASMFHVCAAGL